MSTGYPDTSWSGYSFAVGFWFDRGKEKPFLTRFRNCNAQGCQMVIPSDNSLLTSFKRANDGAARFRLLYGRVVEVKFSLSGFKKAFNALGSDRLPIEQNAQSKESAQ